MWGGGRALLTARAASSSTQLARIVTSMLTLAAVLSSAGAARPKATRDVRRGPVSMHSTLCKQQQHDGVLMGQRGP